MVTILKQITKVVGDNPNDITDTKYGNNNNVMGPDKRNFHGTHVAGLLQSRYNNLGGDGLLIMFKF
jgi:subtilisin family serine protease